MFLSKKQRQKSYSTVADLKKFMLVPVNKGLWSMLATIYGVNYRVP
jgi:hypothetical protein